MAGLNFLRSLENIKNERQDILLVLIPNVLVLSLHVLIKNEAL